MVSDLASVQVTVYGHVQGVFFRDFTLRCAIELELTGYVRNLTQHAGVEVIAEGKKDHLEKLVSRLEIGPTAARVTEIVTRWSSYTGVYPSFSIKH
ncbi:MAG: acylphosphatase [Dehalococcoidales bacterium]|nr:acylphosphatase [Dehalococcoidales bacterium]